MSMQRVTLRVPEGMLDRLDRRVERGEYPSRSEAIRCGIREVNSGLDEDSGEDDREGDSKLVVADGGEAVPIDPEFALEQADRHAHAPLVIRKALDEYDVELLAEVAAEVEETVRHESIERGIGKHGGIAVLYTVINRLADQPTEEDAAEQ